MSANPHSTCVVCGQQFTATVLTGGTVDVTTCADCWRRDWWADAHNGPLVFRGVGWALLLELVAVVIVLLTGVAVTGLLARLIAHVLRGGSL